MQSPSFKEEETSPERSSDFLKATQLLMTELGLGHRPMNPGRDALPHLMRRLYLIWMDVVFEEQMWEGNSLSLERQFLGTMLDPSSTLALLFSSPSIFMQMVRSSC